MFNDTSDMPTTTLATTSNDTPSKLESTPTSDRNGVTTKQTWNAGLTGLQPILTSRFNPLKVSY
jgi:hypothetical protein